MDSSARESIRKELIGESVRRIRESMGMTPQQLADAVGDNCTGEDITQYENGVRNMDADVFFAVVQALGVTPNDFAPQSMRERAPCLFGYAKLNGSHRKLVDTVVSSFLRDESKT